MPRVRRRERIGENFDELGRRLDPSHGNYSSNSLDDLSTTSRYWPGPGYRQLAQRLNVGERGVVKTAAGYYIIQRVE